MYIGINLGRSAEKKLILNNKNNSNININIYTYNIPIVIN